MYSPYKYSLSFTVASFRLHDFLRVAKALDGHEGTVDLNQINAEEILGKGNQKTSNREMAEFLSQINENRRITL